MVPLCCPVQETMILTLGCGKFRIFDQDFGKLPGTDLPRCAPAAWKTNRSNPNSTHLHWFDA